MHYNTDNAEVFSQQISQINDRKQMLEITKALNNARSLYNLIRLSGDFEHLEKLDFRKLTVLSREAYNRLALINTKEALETSIDSSKMLNIALEDVLFAFTKVKEEEMQLADTLKNTLQKTREMLSTNFDQKDKEFITLREELERLFKKKNLSEVSKEEMEGNINELEKIYDKANELRRKNELIAEKYDNDKKYARLHKRLMEKDPLTNNEQLLFNALQSLKEKIDEEVLSNTKKMENEAVIEKMMGRIVIEQLKNKHHLQMDMAKVKRVQSLIVKEYMNEYYDRVA